MKTISIVVPCYNEEDVIEVTAKRLLDFIEQHKKFKFEIIFINDGSSDHTEEKLSTLCDIHQVIKTASFSRNFGHQIAVSAGIDLASGDAVVLIDADLQDPPEVIDQMIDKWLEGYDVVYGTRTDRHGESKFKLLTAKYFYRTLNKLSEVPIPLDTGDFRLMDKKVVEQLKNMPEKSRFVRGMVSWVGFRQTSVNYRRSERFAGESKYPLRKMIKFAFDGILSFSKKPLQLSILFGFACSFIALIGIVYSVYIRLMTNEWVEGWATIFIAILFLGGVQLISIGILGEYVGRIYDETKNRPMYILAKKNGFENK
ncbi:glycosyltransferase family 2 protein [Kosakonia oryzae]|uniref:Dolichol-phosphate mannosyltransferase n=1 Tax=Kosakonia oryzae TaxID=497725 RepID=A0AA94H3Z1_9ENTR|nr:glycosyltransferase family 2 protein [Kosakonia oryzae]ANI82296.1 glycosyltransferase family 2 protein [Kosakonia oryzae]SFC53627.1 dolichol-phosphate mannosyltransferase [Kosakonia oryzae]